MKRQAKQSGSTRESRTTTEGGANGAKGYSGRYRWLMRLMAATLVPLFLLGVLELGLRIGGYGYSTAFFLPREIGGKDFLIPNREFTHPFFPPALARTPLPMRMAAKKPEGTYRIFLLGESAAYGDPDPSFGFGRYLEALLETRYPSTDFEVVNVAITAINSHVILPIARACAKQDGDLWVIYMGNNEMVGPFGAGTIFGERAPSLGFVRSGLMLKSTRLGQLLDALANKLRGAASTPEAWTGIDMFSQNPLRYDDPGRLKAYENFRGNLDDILKVGRKAGVPIILSTVASNLKDCSPFASLHSTGLTDEQLAEWNRHFQEGMGWESEGAFSAALSAYRDAATIDPDFAELQFRIGTCLLALGQPEPAHEAFALARDHDALAVRADTRINQIIREAIERSKEGAVTGVDAANVLADQRPDGILGQEIFYEHVHFTMAGNYHLARVLAEKVAQQLPDSIAATGRERIEASEFAACARRLAATIWDQQRVWDVALKRISVPPFTAQSSHSQNVQYCKTRMDELDQKVTSRSAAQVRRMYENALAREPDDTLIRWNYAQFLERSKLLSEAITQGKLICERLPHAAWVHYFVGSVLAREGRATEAADYLRRALRLQSTLSHAQQELDQLERLHPSVANGTP